jgi:hypothetical protein
LAALTALIILFSALLAYYYQYTGLMQTRPNLIRALGAGCVFLVAALVYGPPLLHRALLYGFYLLFVLELFLQVLAFFGRLPGITTADYGPYSRVYTATGNSMSNSYGWYARPFALKEGSRRVALIGDSFIHSPYTNPDQNMDGPLERLLNESGAGRTTEVFPIGVSGTGPSYYLEMLRYARHTLKADDAVIFVTVVNDFMNSSLDLQPAWWGPNLYIYYNEQPDGSIVFDPRSEPARYRFTQELKLNHKGLFLNLARTIRTHIFLEKAIKIPLDRWRQRVSAFNAQKYAGADIVVPLGGQKELFETPMSPPVQKSVRIGLGVLKMCVEFARKEKMNLRLVVVPLFPAKFYETYGPSDAREWSLQFGRYDFMAPEKAVAAFGKANGVPVLETARYMREKKMSAREIQKLFFEEGTGHFTPAGHEFMARAVYDQFFRSASR